MKILIKRSKISKKNDLSDKELQEILSGIIVLHSLSHQYSEKVSDNINSILDSEKVSDNINSILEN